MCLALAREHYVYTGLGSGFYFVGVSGPSPSKRFLILIICIKINTQSLKDTRQVNFAKNTLTYINTYVFEKKTCVFGKTCIF